MEFRKALNDDRQDAEEEFFKEGAATLDGLEDLEGRGFDVRGGFVHRLNGRRNKVRLSRWPCRYPAMRV